MGESHDLRQLRRLVEAQTLLADHARQTAADHLARETNAREALADQEAKLRSSLDDWASYLQASNPDILQLERLCASISREDSKRADLEDDVAGAASESEAARVELAEADARARLTADTLTFLTRRAANAREEVAARALEDRITFAWSRSWRP